MPGSKAWVRGLLLCLLSLSAGHRAVCKVQWWGTWLPLKIKSWRHLTVFLVLPFLALLCGAGFFLFVLFLNISYLTWLILSPRSYKFELHWIIAGCLSLERQVSYLSFQTAEIFVGCRVREGKEWERGRNRNFLHPHHCYRGSDLELCYLRCLFCKLMVITENKMWPSVSKN